MADNWQLKAVLSAVDQMSPVLKSVGNVARTTRKHLSDVAGAASALTGKIGLPLSLISGMAAGFSMVAIKNAIVGFTDMGEAVQKGALKAGMSVEQYQRMKYVAEQSGTSIEAMEGSMSKLNLALAKGAAGQNKNLAGLMQHLGISMRDSNGEIKSGIDLLPDLADAFERNKNPAVQARMGMALFGKSYAEILPLLSEGSKGIADNLARFSRIKGVLGPDQIKAAKDLGDSFKDLELVTKGFQGTIAKELVPVIKPMVDGLTDWWIVNKKLVGVEVGKMAKDLGQWVSSIDFKQVLKDTGDFVQGLGRFVDMVGGAKNALIGLVVVMNIQTIMAIAGLIGALGRAGLAFWGMAAKAYLAGNVSMLSMLRVAAVALFTAGPIGVLGAAFAWLGGIAAGAGGLISGAMGAVGLAIRGVGAALMANPLGIIIGLATAAYLIYQNWDTLKTWFSGFFDWIGEKFQKVVGWAVDLAKSVGQVFGFGSPGAESAAAAAASSPAAGSGSMSPRVAGADRPSLLAPAAQVKASGQIEVSFKDAPQGMRVEQAKTGGDVPINTNVGYRSYATGMP